MFKHKHLQKRFKHFFASFRSEDGAKHEVSSEKRLSMIKTCWTLGRVILLISPIHTSIYNTSCEILVALVVATTCITIPITFLIMGFSQYGKRGNIRVWDVAPAFRGVGVIGFISLYIVTFATFIYCILNLFYAVQCFFQGESPWMNCGKQNFTAEGCYTYKENRSIFIDCLEEFNQSHCSQIRWRDSAQTFWLKVNGDFISDTTYHTKKRMNFTPYVCSTIILIYIGVRNQFVSLEALIYPLRYVSFFCHALIILRTFLHAGLFIGLKALFTFKIENLVTRDYWLHCIMVGLTSVGATFCGLSTFAAMHNFRYNLKLDAVFLNITWSVFLIVYIVFMYNVSGILSIELHTNIEEIFQRSKHFVFVECPLCLSSFELPKVWTFLFFAANFILLLRVTIVSSIVIMQSIFELLPRLKRFNFAVTAAFCCSLLLSLIPYNKFHDAIYWADVAIRRNLFLMLLVYWSIFLTFFYGVRRFIDDMHFMLGVRPNTLWTLHWHLAFVLYPTLYVANTFLMYETMTTMLFIIHIIVILSGLSPIGYCVVMIIYSHQRQLPIVNLFKPVKGWGPEEEILKKSREMFTAHDMTKEYLYRQERLRIKPDKIAQVGD